MQNLAQPSLERPKRLHPATVNRADVEPNIQTLGRAKSPAEEGSEKPEESWTPQEHGP